ncbi:MAG: alpha/beta fold hydrolase [Lachnospiraceae bacterium]|nr:alpha/beta fold hydrolase [Lachnospiraceae bacterium]
MEKNFDINDGGYSIRSKIYCQNQKNIDQVILFLHGFGSYKDTAALTKFAEKVISKYKTTAVIGFDFPCHGADARKKLMLSECCAYLDLVKKYVHEHFGTERIYIYATSFGGFLILKYIHENGNPFVKIALRSPAVNMYDSLLEHAKNSGQYDKLMKGKEVLLGHERKVKVSPAFFEEIRETNLNEIEFIDFADELMILHGTEDDTVPFAEVEQFADNNIIEFVPFEGDHRVRNPKTMDFVIHTIITFFDLGA